MALPSKFRPPEGNNAPPREARTSIRGSAPQSAKRDPRVTALIKEFEKIAVLKDGWSGENSWSASPEVYRNAKKITGIGISKGHYPSVKLNPSGTITLTWKPEAYKEAVLEIGDQEWALTGFVNSDHVLSAYEQMENIEELEKLWQFLRPQNTKPAQPVSHKRSPVRAPSTSANREDKYSVDPKTGEKFKTLPGVKDASFIKGGMKKVSERAKGLSVSDMRNLIGEDEDFAKTDTFSGGGLDDLAKTFLPHLRIPPSQEEIERLREEKIKLSQQQEKEFEAELAQWAEENENET